MGTLTILAMCVLSTGPDCTADAGAQCVNEGLKRFQSNPPDVTGAARFWAAACNAGHKLGCTNLGAMYVEGYIEGKGHEAAKPWLESGCKLGDGRACRYQGQLLFQTKAYAKALAEYRRGCEAKDGISCRWAGSILETGWSDKETGKADLVQAMDYYDKACRMKVPDGCADQGRLINATDNPKFQAIAKDLFDQACKAGSALGCNHLAVMYALGVAVKPDLKRAFDLYQKACKGGEKYACSNLAYMLHRGEGTAAKPEVAISIWKKLCSARFAEACVHLGECARNGAGLEKDPAVAKQWFKKACELGYQAACEP